MPVAAAPPAARIPAAAAPPAAWAPVAYRPPRKRMVCLEECELRGNTDARHKPLPQWLVSCMSQAQCVYCAREFVSLRALDQHLQDTSAHEVFACCDRTFNDYHAYTQHWCTVHNYDYN
jgi:hypothetical protein